MLVFLGADEDDASLAIEVANNLLQDLFLHVVDLTDLAEESDWLFAQRKCQVFFIIYKWETVEAIS